MEIVLQEAKNIELNFNQPLEIVKGKESKDGW